MGFPNSAWEPKLRAAIGKLSQNWIPASREFEVWTLSVRTPQLARGTLPHAALVVRHGQCAEVTGVRATFRPRLLPKELDSGFRRNDGFGCSAGRSCVVRHAIKRIWYPTHFRGNLSGRPGYARRRESWGDASSASRMCPAHSSPRRMQSGMPIPVKPFPASCRVGWCLTRASISATRSRCPTRY